MKVIIFLCLFLSTGAQVLKTLEWNQQELQHSPSGPVQNQADPTASWTWAPIFISDAPTSAPTYAPTHGFTACSSDNVVLSGGSYEGTYFKTSYTAPGVLQLWEKDSLLNSRFFLLLIDTANVRRLQGEWALGAHFKRALDSACTASRIWGLVTQVVDENGVSSFAYPQYYNSDCAEHPADITATWLSYECANCASSLMLMDITCPEVPVVPTPTPTPAPVQSNCDGTPVIVHGAGSLDGSYEMTPSGGAGFIDYVRSDATVSTVMAELYFLDMRSNLNRKLSASESKLADRVARAMQEEGTQVIECIWGIDSTDLVTGEPMYPEYILMECAESPAEITGTWLMLECEYCDGIPSVIDLSCPAPV